MSQVELSDCILTWLSTGRLKGCACRGAQPALKDRAALKTDHALFLNRFAEVSAIIGKLLG
jgi:hypothetical protein